MSTGGGGDEFTGGAAGPDAVGASVVVGSVVVVDVVISPVVDVVSRPVVDVVVARLVEEDDVEEVVVVGTVVVGPSRPGRRRDLLGARGDGASLGDGSIVGGTVSVGQLGFVAG
jgi:hypothetical protein